MRSSTTLSCARRAIRPTAARLSRGSQATASGHPAGPELGLDRRSRGPSSVYDAPATWTLAFTEAGIFGGKIGLNSAGLGLAINGITTVDDDWAPARRSSALLQSAADEHRRRAGRPRPQRAGLLQQLHCGAEARPGGERRAAPWTNELAGRTAASSTPTTSSILTPSAWSNRRTRTCAATLPPPRPAEGRAPAAPVRRHSDGATRPRLIPRTICRHEDLQAPGDEQYHRRW